ncbi:universal stress protein [Halorubrum halophilum]|uniref:universal stress protein n=1 Tax=Halorubrum halophilum TaxID=413816 RepID=UPI0006787A07|nr:universal stress protein [Halorubrum halophilum]
MYESILVPTDGSESVAEAISEAIGVADLCDATVHAINVVDTAEISVAHDVELAEIEQGLEGAGSEAVNRVADRASERGVDVRTAIRRGSPAQQILDYADENSIDLIIMGTRGHSGMDRILLGSVAETVVRNANRPVMVTHSEE